MSIGADYITNDEILLKQIEIWSLFLSTIV